MMLVNTIRDCLGEDLSKQVEECLRGKGKNGKDIICVVGNDGTFVPIEKYNAQKQKLREAEKWRREISKLLIQIGESKKTFTSADTLYFKNQEEYLEAKVPKVERIEIFMKH